MISVLARVGVTLARVGAVVLSLGVGGVLIVRAQRGANPVAAEASAPVAVPVAHDASAAPPASLPQAPPPLAPVDFAPPAVWLPSSKSLDFAEHFTDNLRPPLVFPEPTAPWSGELRADQAPVSVPRRPVYLHSSKSSTTFVPPSTPGSGWEIKW